MFGSNMKMSQMMSMVNDPDAIQDLILDSGAAAIVADIINIQRLDHARLAKAAGVDADLPRMDDERAAELIAGLVTSDDPELVGVWNELEDVSDDILGELEGEEAVENFQQMKLRAVESDTDDESDE